MEKERMSYNPETTLKELVENGYTMEELLVLIMDALNQRREGKPDEKDSLLVRITNLLREIGMPAHIKGYSYTRTAIKLAYDNPGLLDDVCKGLYPAVANVHETTDSKAERAIRHAINTAWERGNRKLLTNLFNDTSCMTSNSEFIATLVDKLRLEDGKITQ